MTVKPKNLLIIMSDEHSPKALGCYGSEIVKTPHLDALAARGTLFRSAYCASPVCIPARASFAVGKYIHQIGYWDNADAYDGAVPSWHHRLRERDHDVVSIGKLHFRQPGEDHGFSEEIIPMHIIEGKGDLMGLVRSELPVRKGAYKMAHFAGPGESSYTFYDREITARAQVWLREAARRESDKPWVLFVSLVAPHFPLTAPPEHYYRYFNQNLPLPKLYDRRERPDHPYLVDYRNSFNYDDYFEGDAVKRAVAGYYGLCSFLDENIGKILNALEDAGLADDTRVMYTSDHGDNLGARGLWGKSTMFEETAGVPLIMAGDDIPRGRVVDVPVTHIDAYPTVLDAVGNTEPALREGYPGHSLFDIARGETPRRNVLVEYHGKFDPGFQTQWFTSDQIGTWNWQRWSNKDFDDLHKKGGVESDPKKREQIYIDAQKLMDESAAFWWITHNAYTYAFKDTLQPGILPNGSQMQYAAFKQA